MRTRPTATQTAPQKTPKSRISSPKAKKITPKAGSDTVFSGLMPPVERPHGFCHRLLGLRPGHRGAFPRFPSGQRLLRSASSCLCWAARSSS